MNRLSVVWAFIISAIVLVRALPTTEHAERSEESSLGRRARAQLITRCTVPNTAALTFDDGPYNYMRDVVNTLNAARAKGTFFVNGRNWGCIYTDALSKNLKYAYDNGHQIASHTWAHRDLTTLSWDTIHNEMWLVEQAVQRITGATPAFMRPPYGKYNNLVLDASGIRKQSVVTWDFDSGDSTGASVAKQKSSYDALTQRRPSTVLSLQHEVYSSSVYEVLPYAIRKLQGAGYRLVTVAECLGMAPYQSVGAPGKRDASWKC